MSEDESFKKDESYKKFLARVRAILWVWFFSTPTVIITYIKDATPISLSILAFAVIISLTFLLTILTDDKENLSKNIDILTGNEEAKETSNEEAESPSNEQVANSINIPEDYIPKPETEQTTNTLNLGGNDLGKEIGSTSVFLFIFVPAYFYFVDRFFLYMHAFKILFVCSLLYSLLALWRLRKAYFKKGWVKVFARPNNIVEDETSTGGGRMRIRITEGWTFTVDGQQYNVRQGSENHYKKEKEIYWNPQNNKLIINHNSYKILFFLYSLVAYFFFFTGLLLSGQLALHPVTAYPVNVLLFAPVLPIGIIIFCEMYFNQVTLRTVFLNLRDSLLLIVLFLTAFSLLFAFFAVRNWFFSATECSFWIWLTQDFTGVNC
tara:strand:- start:219 stop:1352 length:1134 start_codon:yes stop_codon:yes gene_type:complete